MLCDRLAFEQRPARRMGVGLAPTRVLQTEGSKHTLPHAGVFPAQSGNTEASVARAEGVREAWWEMKPAR